MLEIKVDKSKIVLYKDGDFYKSINLGTDDIALYGFQVVDHIVEEIVLDVDANSQIKINQNQVEGKMIARKLEDKLKIEIVD